MRSPKLRQELWPVRMHFAHFIQNRKALAWAVSLAVGLSILIIAFLLLSGKSLGLFDANELYGILD
jgi:hypothetical protein